MNVKELLLTKHSKSITLKVTAYLIDNPKEISAFLKLFSLKEGLLAQRASWVLSYLFIDLNKINIVQTKKIIELIKEDKYHTAIKRNAFKIFENVDCPEECLGEVIDLSFKAIENIKNPVAIRAYAIGAIQRYCKKYPEFKGELIECIKRYIDDDSPAFKARGKRVIRDLQISLF